MNVSEYGQLTAIYKKIKRYIYIKNHTSFASAIRKGNNYIHCIKVVTKYVRKDYAPLSESSEVGRGIQGLQAVLQWDRKTPSTFMRGEQSSDILIQVAHTARYHRSNSLLDKDLDRWLKKEDIFIRFYFLTLKSGQIIYSNAHLLTWNFKQHSLATQNAYSNKMHKKYTLHLSQRRMVVWPVSQRLLFTTLNLLLPTKTSEANFLRREKNRQKTVVSSFLVFWFKWQSQGWIMIW